MAVSYHIVTEHEAGQRIDNFLLKFFKKVPKSVIYRIVRKGEVRVDKKRVKPDRKLAVGEEIRIPPVRVEERPDKPEVPQTLLDKIEASVLLEDDHLIVLNKPTGLPVHGGSGVKYGLIESFRQLRPNLPFVELVHRLDRDTSGLILLAKSRKVLNALHELLRGEGMDKHYRALVGGKWQGGSQRIITDLTRSSSSRQKIQVSDDEDGKTAESVFSPVLVTPGCSLLDVQILTGRMHQIRVQLAHLGYPIIGDDRYGDFTLNREYKRLGLKRLFLHAATLEFMLEVNGQKYRLEAPLPDDLHAMINKVKKNGV
ncbi:MAG: Ribosomal large subunit pseudouridine synthase C (EC [uncultured Thiotrichaceae bacterium]|uniref:Pseudouridine synthase n=1 Tax=uncultured Thiotrichaceae bacterium TaxID=298394 RepID=A0A6S6U8P0_9GAMM|nr:MAG: Ribosomal large subunit pseudouridine synthase C (EC [uncultured Thiotrichaceae bacterium]